MSRVSVIGAGCVGLVTGAGLAELGHTVACVEIDPLRLSNLEKGELPIHEPGLDELAARHRRAGLLNFSGDYGEAIPESELVFIAVNTPPSPDGQLDTSCVLSAVRSTLEHARRDLIIVIKSTVPVGTGDEVAQFAMRSGRRDVKVVSNPEFLRQGTAIGDFLEPDRIVIGASPPAAGTGVATLYEALHVPMVFCSRRSAELAKYAANALLATRISFINELSGLCEALEADVEEVAQIVGLDRRIGPDYLRAGLGWGGSCLPKDVHALAATAAQSGCRSTIFEAVMGVNARQRQRAVDHLLAAVNTTEAPTVGVLGLAFKPDTDDIRGAPALDIIGRLLEEGIQVRAHDPLAMGRAREVLPDIHYCHDAYDAGHGSDALLLATEWRDYLALDWEKMRWLMRGRIILDGRNALDRQLLSGLGFTYRSFGRSPMPGTNGQFSATEVRPAGRWRKKVRKP